MEEGENKRMTSAARSKITVSIPAELLIDLDKSRGDIPRSLFVQRALERTLVAMNGGIRRRKR
jgi:metal-responsive CopG/Arc/MetJ family transcriptional regulator